MKPAHDTQFLVENSLCFGVFMSDGVRSEHEKGISKMAKQMGLAKQESGLLVTCNRELPLDLHFGKFAQNGQPRAFLSLETRGHRRRDGQAYTPLAAKRVWNFWSRYISHDIWRDESWTARSAWDNERFVICVQGDEATRNLEMVYLGMLAEDCALTYGAGPDGRRGLGAFIVGLTPPAQLQGIRNAQEFSRERSPDL